MSKKVCYFGKRNQYVTPLRNANICILQKETGKERVFYICEMKKGGCGKRQKKFLLNQLEMILRCCVKYKNRGQFHQHFTRSFCASRLTPVKNKPKTQAQKKLHTQLTYVKAAHRMLMKLNPDPIQIRKNVREGERM